jgi:hypothetical protein
MASKTHQRADDIGDIANIHGCLLFLSLMIPELQHPQKAPRTVNMDPSAPHGPQYATRKITSDGVNSIWHANKKI